ncbi:hypothetical protein EZV62_007719 [Acer yangbiense]|uniref:Uncharacterized protein n=1 Tax=Acer yangbiense TaxID=1000413 RepID=A0A5C7IBC5_9ROSI|nr:hypothetical protein EZV62_007719 [Acer yangbiense]
MNNITCENIPNLVSSFVDTLVDFSVSGGLFLPNPDSTSPHNAPDTIITRYPTPDRLIAIGDLHGDLEKSKQAFKMAGLIDDSDRWVGGSSTVVQIGDVLDRGDDEIKILYFLEKLKHEAQKTGGVGLEKPSDIFPQEYQHATGARIAALRPDGPIARRFLSQNVTVLVIGDSVFVHGGLLKYHVDYGFDRINEEVKDWINGLMGKFAPAPPYCRGRNSLVWLRKYSNELAKDCDCSALEHVLATIPGVKRMIMGHTIQEVGINGVCDDRAIRIDVGMSKGCINGLPEVLEINGNSGLRILTSNPLYQNKSKAYLDADNKEELAYMFPQYAPKQVEVKA